MSDCSNCCYHFGSVDELLAAACTASTAARAEAYAERFAAVGSLGELLEVGRNLHAEERQAGNVFVLAQLFAGAQSDPKLETLLPALPGWHEVNAHRNPTATLTRACLYHLARSPQSDHNARELAALLRRTGDTIAGKRR